MKEIKIKYRNIVAMLVVSLLMTSAIVLAIDLYPTDSFNLWEWLSNILGEGLWVTNTKTDYFEYSGTQTITMQCPTKDPTLDKYSVSGCSISSGSQGTISDCSGMAQGINCKSTAGNEFSTKVTCNIAQCTGSKVVKFLKDKCPDGTCDTPFEDFSNCPQDCPDCYEVISETVLGCSGNSVEIEKCVKGLDGQCDVVTCVSNFDYCGTGQCVGTGSNAHCEGSVVTTTTITTTTIPNGECPSETLGECSVGVWTLYKCIGNIRGYCKEYGNNFCIESNGVCPSGQCTQTSWVGNIGDLCTGGTTTTIPLGAGCNHPDTGDFYNIGQSIWHCEPDGNEYKFICTSDEFNPDGHWVKDTSAGSNPCSYDCEFDSDCGSGSICLEGVCVLNVDCVKRGGQVWKFQCEFEKVAVYWLSSENYWTCSKCCSGYITKEARTLKYTCIELPDSPENIQRRQKCETPGASTACVVILGTTQSLMPLAGGLAGMAFGPVGGLLGFGVGSATGVILSPLIGTLKAGCVADLKDCCYLDCEDQKEICEGSFCDFKYGFLCPFGCELGGLKMQYGNWVAWIVIIVVILILKDFIFKLI